jgi:hypothetical protein
MVNIRIVSRFKEGAPQEGGDRRIKGGPLYSREEVLGLIDSSGVDSIILWTQKCVDDQQKYSLDTDDAHRLIGNALKHGRYRKSEWCRQKPSGPWAACDSYSVVDRKWVENAHKDMDFEYFVKFAIAESGAVLLLVSCHPPEERR